MWKSMVATMYKWGTVDNNTVKTAFVLTGRITAADYKEITGEDYEAADDKETAN